jgi:hypothetical protein
MSRNQAITPSLAAAPSPRPPPETFMRPALILASLAALAVTLSILAAIAALPRPLEAQKAETAKPVLTAARVTALPDLKPESVGPWADAPVLTTSANLYKVGDLEVRLRALHDGESIMFLVEWGDATFDTTKKAWLFKDGRWTRESGDEDRIAFAFNVSSPAFAETGCTSLCHGAMDGDKKVHLFHCSEKDALVDLWHWKAARGGLAGYSDDQKMTGDVAKGRQDDDGRSCATANERKDNKELPQRRWREGADKSGPFTEAASVEIPADDKGVEGERIPSNIIREPKGSRGDIQALGRWQDGRWTVVFKRKLKTGNTDDREFKPGESLTFSLALFDNTGAKSGLEHAHGKPLTLTLAK